LQQAPDQVRALGHHFRAKVPGVGAVTLGIHHAKYTKRRSLGYSGPEYPKKGQEYTKNGNTPKNTPGISRGVFNPGYFLSFLRSVLAAAGLISLQPPP
jgi:hypothetical protein